MNNYNSGESFIDHIYQELINSDEVKKAIQRRGASPKSREEAVRYYLERMQHAHSTQRKIEILKRFYYKKYVIDHLPESYVERQWKIAREQGYGNIRITDKMKNKMLEQIQTEQKKSLDSWIDYLNSKDAMYPMWFKYYAFQGMLKLGQFDKEKRKFRKRTKDTTSPFIEVNQEVLGQMYTIISKTIEKQELTEEELKSLEKGVSFQKLYTSLLIQIEENRITNSIGTEGIWIKYEQGDNYQELWKSLQEKNTGWCTAGEEMCKRQIKEGDFYVYYTYDKAGNPTVPRIAIRMNGTDEIAEVRGIGKYQSLEPEMIEIVEAKLKTFPNNEGEKHQKKVSDMRLLTEIERKTINNEELTIEEIIFLYQMESKIEGFGWGEDPRIDEIIGKRKPKEDIKKIDPEIILKGISNKPMLLEYVSTNISNYEKIALKAVKQNGYAIRHVSSNTPNYEKIALEAVKQNGYSIRYVSSNTPNYEQILIEAVKQNHKALALIQQNLITYKVALASVRKNGYALRFIPKDLITEEIALEAIKNNIEAIQFIPGDLPFYGRLESTVKTAIFYKFIDSISSNSASTHKL